MPGRRSLSAPFRLRHAFGRVMQMSTRTNVVEKPVETTGERQDAIGNRYLVGTAPCEECGCPFDFSVEPPGVVWEAGSEIQEECSDPACECHIDPIIGLPFLVHIGF